MSRRSTLSAARARRAFRALALCVLVLGTGCASTYGGGVSLLPSAGLELTAGAPLAWRPSDLETAWEANATYQFFDDENIADDGNPGADPWVQLGLSLRFDGPLSERTRWSFRSGVQWMHAGDDPNIVDAPGDYAGLRLGLGFESLLANGLRTGPEVAILPVWGGDEHELRLVPQLTWSLRWSPRPATAP